MLLLGFARHLTSSGIIDPPCTLPNLPRRSSRTSISTSKKTPLPQQIPLPASAASKWRLPVKDLCGECWAMRVDESPGAKAKCQRCGRKHRRGFVRGNAKRDDAGSSNVAVGPVPWQQFTQVSKTHGYLRKSIVTQHGFV